MAQTDKLTLHEVSSDAPATGAIHGRSQESDSGPSATTTNNKSADSSSRRGLGKKPKALRLTPQEVTDRLLLGSPDLIEEIYGRANKLVDDENAIFQGLTGKAGVLLGAIGVSTSLAVALAKTALFCPVYPVWLLQTIRLSVVVALILAGISVWNVVRALMVSGKHQKPDEKVLLDQSVLAQADANPDIGLSAYRRYVTAHLWQIYQNEAIQNKLLAKNVKWGQIFYVTFLVVVCLLGAVTTFWPAEPISTSVSLVTPRPL